MRTRSSHWVAGAVLCATVIGFAIPGAADPGEASASPVGDAAADAASAADRDQAFEDIYYEHCSYFSPGSLARLFRSCDFDVVELTCDFDDQYIILVAKPSAGPTEPRHALEDDLEHLREFAAEHDLNAYINLLARDGNLTLVGAPETPLPIAIFGLLFGRRSISGSLIGGIAETQEMLDFCGEHGITADVEVIPIQQINEAYERMLRSDVKYRFSIDMASLKTE